MVGGSGSDSNCNTFNRKSKVNYIIFTNKLDVFFVCSVKNGEFGKVYILVN